VRGMPMPTRVPAAPALYNAESSSSTQSASSTVSYVAAGQLSQPAASPPPRSHAHRSTASSPKREEAGAKPKPPSQRFAFQMKTTSTKYAMADLSP
jgi:hypothetical protein